MPIRISLLIAGLCLIAVAALWSSLGLSRIPSLHADGPQWGPTLFRVLLAFHGLVLTALGIGGLMGSRIGPRRNGRTTASTRHQTSKLAWIALGSLCVVALMLRIVHLNSGLWHDEITALLDFVRPSLGETLTSFPNQNQHMLYSVLAKAVIGVFGESVWALRLPAALFGVASIWALFLLARRVIGVPQALIACALMTFSYHHIWFSQNARGYSGLLFFTLLATWLWVEALPRRSWGWWTGYVVSVSLGMWIHLTMAFVAATHGLTFLILASARLLGHQPKERLYAQMSWQPIVALALCATVTLQLYALSLPDFLSTGLHEVSLPSEWTNPLWLVVETGRGLLAGFSASSLAVGGIVLLGGALLMGLGWFSILRAEWPVAVVMVLPGLLTLAVMLLLAHNLWPRFVFFSAGFAIIFVVHGAFKLFDAVRAFVPGLSLRTRASDQLGYALSFILLFASIASLPKYYALPKQDYQGALDYVEAHRIPGDVVVVAGLANTAYTRYYAVPWIAIESKAALSKVLEAHKKVWFVYALPVHFRSHYPDLLDVIERRFEMIKVFPGTLAGGEVCVLRVRPIPIERPTERSRAQLD